MNKLINLETYKNNKSLQENYIEDFEPVLNPDEIMISEKEIISFMDTLYTLNELMIKSINKGLTIEEYQECLKVTLKRFLEFKSTIATDEREILNSNQLELFKKMKIESLKEAIEKRL